MRRQLLGVAERPDAGAHAREPLAVVPDHLLRPQERRRTEAGREARLPAGRQHVVRAGQVVAEADRRVLPEEDRAGVRDQVERRARVGGLQLEVLGAVGVAERGGGRDVVDQHDRRLARRRGRRSPAPSADVAAASRASSGSDGVRQLGRIGDQHRGREFVVLGLADQVGGDEAGVARWRRR